MKNISIVISLRKQVFFLSTFVFVFLILLGCSPRVPDRFSASERFAEIFPDYRQTTIPPNIAPMNFQIREEGTDWRTRISTDKENSVVLRGKDIRVAPKIWKKMLEAGKGKRIKYEIFVKQKNGWFALKPFENEISEDPVDSHITYRLIPPGYDVYAGVELCERNLESFDERTFFHSRLTAEKACANCHLCQNRDPGTTMFHLRNSGSETIFTWRGKTFKRDLAAQGLEGGCTYAHWHPTLPLVVFSVNKARQFFHTVSLNRTNVLDFLSDLVLFDLEKNKLTWIRPPGDDDFETMPFWSEDGKTLYYSSVRLALKSPRNDTDARARELSQNQDAVYYNLMAVSFDQKTRSFGEPQIIFDTQALKKSAIFPRESPDGKFIMFTLLNTGTLPIWRPDSDLWLLDRSSGKARPLTEVNSPRAEGYHVWDSSGRWFLFSSRRGDGLYTRLYLAHFDRQGNAAKPFLLPQADPVSADLKMKSYNVPEIMTGPVQMKNNDLINAVFDRTPPKASFDPHEQENKP